MIHAFASIVKGLHGVRLSPSGTTGSESVQQINFAGALEAVLVVHAFTLGRGAGNG